MKYTSQETQALNDTLDQMAFIEYFIWEQQIHFLLKYTWSIL